MKPIAAVVRGDFGPGVVYFGYEPELILAGSAAETGRLEEELARRSRKDVTWDQPHPSGAAIGGFDFEGNWHFSFFRDWRRGLWGSFGPRGRGWG